MNDTFDVKKRHLKNPFGGTNVIQTKNQRIVIGVDDEALISHDTGEVKEMSASTYIEVDDLMFIELISQNVGLTFNLTSCGIKALTVLLWAVQKRKVSDVITMDKYTYEEFLQENKAFKFSYGTFSKGLNDLTKAQIIAKAKRMGRYYFNSNFIFNGDHIRFVTEIRRKPVNKQAKLEEKGQQRLLD